MIVALLHRKGGVGKTTLALHFAGEWARRGQRVTLIDADSQGSALDWSQQRARESLPRLFGVIGSARDTLHREAPELTRNADHIVIDGLPRVAGLMRSALLAADIILIPVQRSPFDGWGSAEMLASLSEARLHRPQLVARFVLTRCGARTVIAHETALTLADHDPSLPASRIGQRVAFAEAAQSGRLLGSTHGEPGGARDHGPCARSREAGAMTQRSSKRAFIARPADPERWIKTPEPRSSSNGDVAAFTARLTIDITPELRGRIKVVAVQRGLTVADLLREPLAREFPPAKGDLP